jgi:transposase
MAFAHHINSIGTIASVYGVSRATAYRRLSRIRRLETDGLSLSQMEFPKAGRPSKTTAAQREDLRRMTLDHVKTELIPKWAKGRSSNKWHPKTPKPTPEFAKVREFAAAIGISCSAKQLRRLLVKMGIVTTGRKNYGRGPRCKIRTVGQLEFGFMRAGSKRTSRGIE